MKLLPRYLLEIFLVFILTSSILLFLNKDEIRFYTSNSIIDYSIIPNIQVQSTTEEDFFLIQEINLNKIHLSDPGFKDEPLCAVFWPGLPTKSFTPDQPIYSIKLIADETTWEWFINNKDIGSHFQNYCPKESQPIRKLVEAKKAYFEITTPFQNTQKHGQIILAPSKNSPPAIINGVEYSSLMLPYRLTANPSATMLEKFIYIVLTFFTSLIIWLALRIGLTTFKKSNSY